MGISYNTSIVRDGLVLHLDAANSKSYPGSGTTWYDLSGNGNNASLIGNSDFVTFNDGYFSHDPGNNYFGAVDGSSYATLDYGAYWNIPSNESLNPGVSGWTVSGFMSVNGSQSGNGGGWFCMDDVDLKINIEAYGTGIRANGVDGWSQINYNLSTRYYEFHYYTFVFTQSSGVYGTDPGEIKMFIDGVLVFTDSSFTPGITTDYQISLGRRRGHFQHFMRTDISNYHFYTRALSDDEIKQNFNALKTRYGL